MHKEKVLLVQPNYRHQRESGAWGFNPPLGLAYIAAVLEENDIKVEIIDANVLDLSPSQVVDYAVDFHASIVGVSMLTPAHNYGVSVAQRLPDDILSVAGGPHTTGIPKELLKDGFDVVVRGEGELTMLELAQEKDLSEIHGISYLDGEKIYHNPPRPPIDPDTLPFPARHLLESNGVDTPYYSANTKYRPWADILTSRGCPYSCYYCNKNIFGHKIRYRSVENVVSEIEFLKEEYGIKEISICDDNFNFNLERAEKILDQIIEKDLDIHIRCHNGLRVDKITKEFLNKMKRAGGCYIAFGIESGNQAVLDKIPKGTTIEQIKKAVTLTKKAGIETCGYFIFGLIGDSKESMKETLDLAIELDLDVTSFHIATPYPGTRLWDTIKRDGELFTASWDDYHHTAGKMMFTYPGTADPETVEKMYRKAYSSFYFRPKYVFKRVLKIRSLNQIKTMFRGLIAILKIRGWLR